MSVRGEKGRQEENKRRKEERKEEVRGERDEERRDRRTNKEKRMGRKRKKARASAFFVSRTTYLFCLHTLAFSCLVLRVLSHLQKVSFVPVNECGVSVSVYECECD